MGRVRNSYTVKEKLSAIKYAKAHGNRAAGREFNVSESCIRDWRKIETRLMNMNRKKRANRGKSAKYPELEQELFNYIVDKRKQGYCVSTTQVRLKALDLAKSMAGTSDFKASVKWTYGFFRRHLLSIRRRTHIAQKLPEDYEEKLVEFQKFVIKMRKQNDYELSQIGNAGQTPLTFDIPYDTSIDVKGTKSVNIKTTGNEKNRFTVMLSVTADGAKLPPYIIFKRKTLPKEQFPKGVIVRVQEKGWMDDNLVLDWVENVWCKRPGGLIKKRSLLVLDAFRCHRSEKLKEKLKSSKTDLCIIPGGMTSMLQPLDVSINKPMKSMMRAQWNEWMSCGDHQFTKGGHMKKVDLVTICSWVLKAWNSLDTDIIVKSFKKCCISNAMDGSEDDALWEDLCENRHNDDDSDSDDESDVEDFYTDELLSDEAIRDLFASDDEESDFNGFRPDDL